MATTDNADNADSAVWQGGDETRLQAAVVGLSARAAGAALGISERTVRRAIARGQLPATKYAGIYRITPEALGRYRMRLIGPIPIRQVAAPARPLPLRGAALLATLPVVHFPPLPRVLSPLIGRAREAETAISMLRTEGVRLLTLTGPGGVGKTRLALQVASDLEAAFEGAVAFIGLDATRDPALLPLALARTLGVRESSDQPLTLRIAAFLHDKACLLVLDNFEQITAAAPFVGSILAACPRLQILVTSRVPLHLSGEREFPVPPLTLPERAVPPSPVHLDESDAVRLFVDRVRAILPDFVLTDENAPTVAELCRRLDGLPLAIELAAARTKVLPPRALLPRLDHRLPLLTGGPHDQPLRLQTMRNAIAWSYDLLSPGEQALFRRLAVFAGGFTLEAAERVGGEAERREGGADGSSVASPRDVLNVLASLIDKSLVQQTEQPDGEPRFGMLETIGEYGREQLATCGEASAVRAAHAAYNLALAERADDAFWGKVSGDWRTLLVPEHANFRVAHAWFVERGEIDNVLRLSCALEQLWQLVGHPSEGRRWLDDALGRAAGASAAARAKALAKAGILAAARGDHARAMAFADESLALAKSCEDPYLVALAINVRALATQYLGRTDEAVALLEDVAARYRELGERGRLGRVLCRLAMLGDLGTFDRPGNPAELALATARAEEGMAFFQELGLSAGVAWALHCRAVLAYKQRDFGRAGALVRETLALRWDLANVWELAVVFEDLADIAGMTKQPERAARLYGAAEALRETLDLPIPPYDLPEHEREVAVTRAQLSAEAFADAWQFGRAMPLADAVTEALMEPLPAPAPERKSVPATAHGLSRRELDVLRLLAEGLTDREIAAELFITYRTTTTYVTNILTKLDVFSRTAAATYAVRHGLV